MTIEDDRFDWQRKPASIEREAALDGSHVIRTSNMKKVDLKVRPIRHHHSERVSIMGSLCMLACYVEWHMRRALPRLLFDEEDHEAAETQRSSIVAPAQGSLSAQQKAVSKQAVDGFPVHSFRTLLADLGTLTRNRVRMGAKLFDMLATPTTLQDRAFELLQVRP